MIKIRNFLKYTHVTSILKNHRRTGNMRWKLMWVLPSRWRILHDIISGFRKVHMREFCYSIRDMNYSQMRVYAFYGIQPSF